MTVTYILQQLLDFIRSQAVSITTDLPQVLRADHSTHNLTNLHIRPLFTPEPHIQ
jgi:hypothetical protein